MGTRNDRLKLLYNFSSLSFIQVANFILSLLVIPFVVRKIGADGFGSVAVAQAVMIYLAVITEYGFNQTATREVALYKDDKEKISRIFSTVVAAKVILCVCCFIILSILVVTIPFFKAHSTLYLVGFSFVVGYTFLPNWFYLGMEKMQYFAIPLLVGKLMFVVLVFMFIREEKDSVFFLLFMGAGNAMAAFFSTYLAFRIFKLHFIVPGKADIVAQLKDGWHVTVSNLSNTTCQYTGIFILRIFTNDLIVGYYSIAERIYFGMKLMLGAFSQAVYPRICQLIHNGRSGVRSFLRKTYYPFLAAVGLCCILMSVFSTPILQFFIGHESPPTVLLLRLFCVALFIAALNIPANLILLADNHKKSYLRVFTIATVLNLLANAILARFYYANGTVAAVIITEIFITIGVWREVYRHYMPRKEV
jgi:polysaccharide transporter, PST family